MKQKNKQIVGFVILSILVGLVLEMMLPSGNAYKSLFALKITLYLLFMATFFGVKFVITRMNDLYLSLSSEKEKEAFLEEQKTNKIDWSDWNSIVKALTKAKPIEEEGEIAMDHDFDGIVELDNNLPPWWLYGFYMTIAFAVIYMVRYHVFEGENQDQEYLTEVKLAEAQIAAYEATQEKVDLTALAGGDNSEGKKLFKRNCAVCHAVDGGGKIGPNLTDDYWILGGGIENVYKTIAEGGRPGKGMIAWKNSFSPQKLQQLAAYVVSLKGTTPEDPKEPQGDLYKE